MKQDEAQAIVQQANDLYGEVAGTEFWIYGSPMRPMFASWARIEGARYVNADKQVTGMHTWAVVPNTLSQEMVDRFDLTLIYAPGAMAPNGRVAVMVKLAGEDGNAFAIIGRCMRAMRRAGWGTTEIRDFEAEATSGNYDHLLATVMEYCQEPQESAEQE